ncbi:MAG: hypothetical protein ACYTGZ_07440 [Planctomycetota bacterium]|jgi:hypothetical protein
MSRFMLLTLPCLLLSVACASSPSRGSGADFSASSEPPAIQTGPSRRHVARAFVGGTTERGGGGLTLGGQYEYRITDKWGAGGLADVTIGSDVAVVLGGAGYWHPIKELTLLAAPAVDFENDDFFVRLGGSYDFEVKDFLLGPAVYVDIGAKGTPILAGLIVSFDF